VTGLKLPAIIQIETGLEAGDLRDGHDLYAVLHSALKGRAADPPSTATRRESYWPAAHFGLDRVTAYREAGGEEQASILAGCSRDLLAESYFIEKSGMYFAAKMALLARSAQERMLYSLFAADEAAHFSWIAGYAAGESVAAYHDRPFIRLLDEILQSADKPLLTCVVQVVLEGWGISHYHALMRDCLDGGLRATFEKIIKDEARHHASGVILLDEQPPAAAQRAAIIEALRRLLLLVQVGPQSVVAQIERVKGRLSSARRERAFAELDCERETAKKLETLKTLIRQAASAGMILEALEAGGAFRPYSAVEGAAARG
jgi:rubrerythrin